MATLSKDEILDGIANLSVLELSELLKDFEERFAVSTAAPVVTGPVVPQTVEPEVEEQTEFDVFLVAVGEKKINVIKEVRLITRLGLKEGKDLVDAVVDGPSRILEQATKEEAEAAKVALEAVGATVEVK